MDRKEFINLVGLGGVGLLTMQCFGCSKEKEAEPQSIDFTLDLNDSSNAVLKQNGGFKYNQNVIVARTITGNYVAVSQACTHQGTNIVYQTSVNNFHCPNHGSNFSVSGEVQNGPATQNLKLYNTSLSGNFLRIFS